MLILSATFPLSVPMVCRNVCEKIYSKIVVGESHYFVGKKYCRRCECYFITSKVFCQCCGMQLRFTLRVYGVIVDLRCFSCCLFLLILHLSSVLRLPAHHQSLFLLQYLL